MFEIIANNIPLKINLFTIKRSAYVTLVLENGQLNLNKFNLSRNPLCSRFDDKLLYDFAVEFKDLIGRYDWRIMNLFGYNFSEVANIMV